MTQAVPKVQTSDRTINQLQDYIGGAVGAILKLPLSNSVLLKSVSLSIGTNNVNHTLGRELIGWLITRKRAAANIYDSQETNTMPTKTLNLVSDANVEVDLIVF